MMRRIAAILRPALLTSALLLALAATQPAAAQVPTETPALGCCLCLDCPGSAGFCTNGRTALQCSVACIVSLNCNAFVFGLNDACMMDGSCAMVAPATATPTASRHRNGHRY
jgi:hypothetical protein